MAARDAIVAFLDDLLEADGWDDYGPNGLQVPGAAAVDTVVTGVSAHRELFELAVDAGGELVLCHHGLFWDRGPSAMTVAMRERLRVLFDADASLAAYHLPLDAHREVGNNALLCEALGFERGEPFGLHRGRPIGFVGRAPDGVGRADLAERCVAALGREPLVFGHGPDPIRTLGVVSGGGASSLGEATRLGLDGFLTGEPEEWAMADAREAGINFFAAGHYATETLGVRRLGELLERELGVTHRFIEVPNPVRDLPQFAETASIRQAQAVKLEHRIGANRGGVSMAIHLTPTELAREAGMHRREVIARCMQLGVPIFEGRIDKTLFLTSLKASRRTAQVAKT